MADLDLELGHLVRSCMSVMVSLGHTSLVGGLWFPSYFYDEPFVSSLCILYI